jgi:hypothetical protein
VGIFLLLGLGKKKALIGNSIIPNGAKIGVG